jgi:predicted nucleic acid-binding protein
VPLFIKQQSSPRARALAKQYRVIVWWATPIEVKSAFARLFRMGQVSLMDVRNAQVDLTQIRRSWLEIQPSAELRDDAEAFLDRFPLKAADALQLAAANAWSMRRPRGRVFISGDAQLLDAARQLGFDAEEA